MMPDAPTDKPENQGRAKDDGHPGPVEVDNVPEPAGWEETRARRVVQFVRDNAEQEQERCRRQHTEPRQALPISCPRPWGGFPFRLQLGREENMEA